MNSEFMFFLFKEGYASPRPVRFATVMEWMKDRAKVKGVLVAREMLQLRGEAELPASKWPPVVLLNYKRYNGIVLLEVDKLAGRAEVDRIRRKAAESPQTLAAFSGWNGQSVKLLVRFSLPDGSLPVEKEEVERFHAHAYRQAVNYYRMQIPNLRISDSKISDSGLQDFRLQDYKIQINNLAINNLAILQSSNLESYNLESSFLLSFDPDLYVNPDAAVITLPQPLRMPARETWAEAKMKEADPLERLMPGMERSRRISLLYETSLQETLAYFGGFQQDDPKLFLVRLAENCCRSGIPEEDAVKWSVFHSELCEHEMELRTTIRNVYSLSKRFGQKPCLNASQQLALQLEDFMQRRYEFRRNDIKREVEFRERRSYYFDFLPVTDEALNTFSIQAHGEGLSFWDRDVKRYVHSNLVPAHNPVDYYLDHLPAWDGADHIRALARTIPTKNADWPDQFYRWFLGLTAQWKQMNKTHANSVVPLLVGTQGCGKSTWCRNLVPSELRDYYTDSLDFSSKRETEMALHRFALINLDEFDSISLSHQPFLKHLLQKPEINARRPYKSSIQLMKRYGVFIATCNNMDLLSDPTGSRRFLCVEISGTIQPQPIHYEQLYAQALHALRQGERYWFDKEEERAIINNNTAFEQKPVEEQLLLRYFSPAGENEEGEWLMPIEIIRRLQETSKMKFGHLHVRQFGRILKKNQIPMKHTVQGNFYHVKQNA